MLGVNGLPKSTLPELFWSLIQEGGEGGEQNKTKQHYIVFKTQLQGKSFFKLKMFSNS